MCRRRKGGRCTKGTAGNPLFSHLICQYDNFIDYLLWFCFFIIYLLSYLEQVRWRALMIECFCVIILKLTEIKDCFLAFTIWR